MCEYRKAWFLESHKVMTDSIIHDSLLLSPQTHPSLPRVRIPILQATSLRTAPLSQAPLHNSSSSPPSSALILPQKSCPTSKGICISNSHSNGWPIRPRNFPQSNSSFFLFESLQDLLSKFSKRFGAIKIVLSIFLIQKQRGKTATNGSPFHFWRQVSRVAKTAHLALISQLSILTYKRELSIPGGCGEDSVSEGGKVLRTSTVSVCCAHINSCILSYMSCIFLKFPAR